LSCLREVFENYTIARWTAGTKSCATFRELSKTLLKRTQLTQFLPHGRQVRLGKVLGLIAVARRILNEIDQLANLLNWKLKIPAPPDEGQSPKIIFPIDTLK
jgi:hypothetical protein